MRKLGITRLWNKPFVAIQIPSAVIFSITAAGQDSGTPPAGSQPAPTSGPPSPQSAAPATSQGPSISPQTVEKDEGMFVMHKSVEEVALHATVMDDKDHLLTNLDRT